MLSYTNRFTYLDMDLIEELKEDLNELSKYDGIVSINSTMGTTEVHMLEDAFCNLFEEWELKIVTPSMMKRSKTVNGIHYFSYENIEIEEDEEIEQEPKQNNLPAIVLDNEKIDIITMLVNYYIANNPQINDLLEDKLIGIQNQVQSIRNDA